MRQRGFSTVLILIVITILALGGYLYYQKQNKVSISPAQQVTNYNTFTSKRVGFSFQYPSNWPLSVASDQDLKNFNNQYTEALLFDKSFYWNASDKPLGYIFVEKASSGESIQTYAQKVNNDYEQLPANIKQKSTKPAVSFTKVADIDTVMVSDGGSTVSFNSPNITYVLFNNGLKYTLALQHLSEKNSFNQLLSSLKFTDQNQVDTTNWKTYTNNKYGYLIKYPEGFKTQPTTITEIKEAPADATQFYIYDPTKSKTDYSNKYDYVSIDVLIKMPSISEAAEKTNIKIGNVEALKVIDSTRESIIDYYYINLPYNKGVLMISVSNTPSNKAVASQILSTFKFQ